MHCPALDGGLCSRCCGTGRGSEIQCTRDCELNPFGIHGYEKFSEIDSKLPTKMMRIMARNGATESSLSSMIRKFSLRHAGDEGDTGVFGGMIDWFFHEPASGREESRWELREDLGFGRDLSNDETRIMEARRHSLPTLIELQRTEGTNLTWARDLLEPELGEFRIMDKSLVSAFEPFMVAFGYLTQLDHFFRTEGSFSIVPIDRRDELIDFIELESDEDSSLGKKEWLRLHTPMVAEQLRRLMEQAKEDLLANLDPTLVHSIYRSSLSRNQWLKHLLPAEELEEGDPEDGDGEIPTGIPVVAEFEWLRQGGSKLAPKSALSRSRLNPDGTTTELLGTIMIADGYVAISCYGKGLAAWLREHWEREFAPSDLVYERESLTDLLEMKSTGEKQPIKKQPPPEQVNSISREFEQRHYERLLQEAVPALNGMTPLQAAGSNSQSDRRALESWAKGLVQNLNSRYGRDGADFAWFFSEIGCAEFVPREWRIP